MIGGAFALAFAALVVVVFAMLLTRARDLQARTVASRKVRGAVEPTRTTSDEQWARIRRVAEEAHRG